MEKFTSLFDFDLTRGQEKCIKDIERDMASEKPMYRLLQGDVGSGKTVAAMFAMMLARENGYQSVIMAPTEILARQHYITLSRNLMPLGVNVSLLAGGIRKEYKERILSEVRCGEADILVGTHSCFREEVDFNDLGLVVIDEQHKFGVEQRASLRSKMRKADTLVMTATPIPRSLAMTVYGDMDISFLKDKPAGRKKVTTFWAGEEQRDDIYRFLRKEVSSGRQVFIVCPRIDTEGKKGLSSAVGMYENLKNGVFSDLKLALLHGRMKADEKDRIMEGFKNKKYDVLISTTVVEVGVDIPNASVMLIENADRYGLAQLHQLRGRIGRGRHSSYCVLMGEARTDQSRERLSTISEIEDGFRIAEKDLDIRGPGEFFGRRQSGLPELKIGNIVRDFEIMEEAREDAFNLVKSDPDLARERHSGIKKAIRTRFKGKVSLKR